MVATHMPNQIANLILITDSLHNNISPPSKLALGSNYHLFKNGIEPKWEDSSNTRGGKWVLVIPRAHRASLDEFWLRTVLFLIGEDFEHCDDICGCVVSVRKAQDKIAIWTADATKEHTVRAIGMSMRSQLEIPADIRIGYQSHHDSIQHNSSYNNQSLLQL
eukprot:c1123_g1_i2.p1 GENE.c1123_g1_i2~~c1123_g1_i2.p1  ORF type:complete len:162 (-),score=44.65 c1123_g1_i2:586-1071(-)